MRRTRSTPHGRVRCTAADERACAAGVELVERLGAAGRLEGPLAGAEPFADRRAWIKGGPLRGKARVRHAGRRWLLARALPREAEYRNLVWLRSHLFRVPVPLAAVSVWRGALPTFQLLVLEELEAPSLDRVLAEGSEATRPLLLELAQETARMHALGFAHRDLYPRNVLVAPRRERDTADGDAGAVRGDPRRLRLLDAWSGAPPRGPAGPDRIAPRDLACTLLEAANLLTPAEQRLWFEAYLAERAAQGCPADRGRLLARMRSERARMLRRIAREPGRWRLDRPPADWAL